MEMPRVQGKRILLVEDDPGARQSIRLLLTIDRHHVTEATNSRAALALLAREYFDLVITDYYMPEFSGAELAEAIKANNPSQPILMVSAFLEKLQGSCKAVDILIGKPFSVDSFREALVKLLA
jgi:CheY-like chemotaxis protein